MAQPAVSVIASNFNGAKYLPRLIETLTAQRHVTVELIVVDRNSKDESAAILSAHPSVRVISEPPETGLVSGYSAGAAVATHPLLFFCNEDMWFQPDCLAKLAGHFDAPDVGAADPWEWTYDEATLIHAGVRFVPAVGEQNSPFPARKPDFFVPLPAGTAVPFGCAGAIMVRRDVYDAVGGWDRSFFLDGEDLDLFIRFWQAGWRVVTEPDARVYHAVNVSNTKTIGNQVSVGRRRYESGRSSVLVMAVKYLPAVWVAWVGVLWAAALGWRVLLLRFKQAGWDISALREFRRRLPAALAYRRSHRELNRRKPVTKFFRAAEFQR